MQAAKPAYKRVIVKLSGETLGRSGGGVLDREALVFIARNVKEAVEAGSQVGIVVGGGNIVRGVLAGELGVERTTVDQMGMLATVINGLALRDALGQDGLAARLFSSIDVGVIAEPYHPLRARSALDRGEVGVFSGGTGNPFVSTDTAAVLRACDVQAQAVLKATKVDGVYSADPVKNAKAVKLDRVTCDEAIRQGLKIMDFSALGLAKENRIPVLVFNFWAAHALRRAVLGERLGTLMRP